MSIKVPTAPTNRIAITANCGFIGTASSAAALAITHYATGAAISLYRLRNGHNIATGICRVDLW